MRRSHQKVFLFLALAAILLIGAEQFVNFDRGSPKKHSCEIISKSIHQFGRKSCLKGFPFLALAATLFSQAEQFEQFCFKGDPRSIPVKLFQNPSTDLEERSFKGFPILKLWLPACSSEWNGLSNYGKGSPKEHFCVIILKSCHWPRRRCCLKVFQPFCSVKQKHFRIFGRSPKEHFCVITCILKSGHWPRRRCCLKVYLFFSSGGHFVQQSGTILATLVEGHPRNISENLFVFLIPAITGLGGDVV